MSWSRLASCLIASALLLSACGCTPELQVVGESVKTKDSESPPRQSAFFDGSVVELEAARGETLGVQVLLNRRARHRVRLELPLEVAEVTAFAVTSLEVSEPSTAMYGKSLGRGRYPDVLSPAGTTVETAQRAFFDVAVRRSALPGRFSGRLYVGDDSHPVELTVRRVSLEIERAPLVWVFYLPKEIARAHGLEDDDGPNQLAIEARYHELFRRHGAFLAANMRPDRFAPRRRFLQGLRYWPVSVNLESDATIEADVRRWLSLFEGSDTVLFAIPIDEPRTLEQKQRARRIAETIGRAGGRPPRLLRAVTDRPNAVYGDAIDLYFSPDAHPAPPGSRARFFTYNGRPPQAGSMILDTDGVALRTWGWIAYRYGLDLWYAWEGLYFTDRYNHGGPTDVLTDPLTFDERSQGGEDFGNGDGLLAYPGPLPSLRLKALRRGLQDRLLLRRLQECGAGVEAGRIARQMVPRALGEAVGEVSWPTSEQPWEAARRRLLELAEQRCPS
jgi:hypothetical protein